MATFIVLFHCVKRVVKRLEKLCTSAGPGFELPVPEGGGENLDRGGCRTSMVRAGWVEVIGVGMGQAAWR